MHAQDNDFESSLPKVKCWGNEVLYQFHGFWFPPIFLGGTQEVVNNFKPFPNDVILASFPKTGTTWLKSLVYSILNRSSKQELMKTHPHELVPMLELQVFRPGVRPPEHFLSPNASSGRVLSTHLPHQIFGKTVDSSECKVIYIARNPKDTLISLWHFTNTMEKAKDDPWPLEDAVDKFCKGFVIYGPYYDHVLGYQKESLERPKKFLFLSYEDLKSDTKSEVKRLAEFLGRPFEEEEEVEEVVRSCSIEALKKHEVNTRCDVPSWGQVPYDSFFRKGLVGDHRNYLSAEMIERIDAITGERFLGPSFGAIAK